MDPALPVPSPSVSLLKDIVNAPVSMAIAFAFVLFAAGSVASMTAVAYEDISRAGDDGSVVALSAIKRARVLGESTTNQVVETVPMVNDSELEAVEPLVKMEARPISFNSNGRWNYKIGFNTKNFSGTGKITIGSFVVKDNLTTSGYFETGAILKPGRVYRVSFWGTDSSGVLSRLQSIELKTAKAKTKKESCEGNYEKCPFIGTEEEYKKKCMENSTECYKVLKPCIKEDGSPCVPWPCPEGKVCPAKPTTTPPQYPKPTTTTNFYPR